MLQLFQLTRQVPEGVGVAEGLGGGVDQGHRAAPAHPFSLAPGGVDQLSASGEDLLVPYHVAGDGHGVLAHEAIGNGGGVRVVEIGRRTHAEVHQYREEDGGKHQFCGKRSSFHMYLFLKQRGDIPEPPGPGGNSKDQRVSSHSARSTVRAGLTVEMACL